MKRILLIGPIGDYGGREIEAGFIATTLSETYHVEICSTGKITKKSQVFDFNPQQKILSLPDLMLKKYLFFRIISFFSLIKNNFKGNLTHYAKNYLSKKMGYDKKVKSLLEDLIPKYDLVFICAQLSSEFMPEVIALAEQHKIKTIFRTTGTISNVQYDYVPSVDLFLHHSEKNAQKLELGSNYRIIDQCAFNESELQKIKPLHKKIHTFLVLGRLSPEKGVAQLIDFFLQARSENDVLVVAGNGILEHDFKSKYNDINCIRFTGLLRGQKLITLFDEVDSLIIPSPEESGPMSGIEAMCSGKIIISTKVGAMQERLKGSLNNFWYDYGNFDSFQEAFNNVKLLGEAQVGAISENLKTAYTHGYCIDAIKSKYLDAVKNIL